ncbi:MAG TPA: peroxiredoxin [Vicinamibacteria bacterium]|nr:peroxiredoxin [Vicinamibacteria bacterium]
MLKPGDKAPTFRLPSTSGSDVSLSSLKGRKFVLYFYPKDDTPGCTREACDFQDNLARLQLEGASVFGVSKDSLESHRRFQTKHGLGFDLLSDPENLSAKAYGAYGTKSLYGRKFLGTIRSTFVVDEKGRIAAAWSPVRVAGHVDEVIAHLRGESAPTKRTPRKKKKK